MTPWPPPRAAGDRPRVDTNRTVALIALAVAALLAALMVVPPLIRGDDEGAGRPPAPTGDGDGPGPADRTRAPLIGGRPLEPVSDQATPPAPEGWAGGNAPVPTNSWWTSALAGAGAPGLWPQPLALVITQGGEVQVANPAGQATAEGAVEAPFIPALFLDVGSPATTRVLDHGPSHVVIEVASASRRLELTLVQGSPVVEVTAAGPVHLRVPGLDGAAPSGQHRSVALRSSEGAWALGGADPLGLSVAGDDLTVMAGPTGRFVLGPVPEGSDGWPDRLAALAGHRLEGTEEVLEVADDGRTQQVLRQVRAGKGDTSLWALQPHHRRYRSGGGPALGELPSVLGNVPVVAGDELRIDVPAVPVLWSVVPLPGGPDLEALDAPIRPEGEGSYFKGKAAYAAAARGELLHTEGAEAPAESALAEARGLLDALEDPERLPVAHWDSRWGSVVVEPAEFGAGTELNDHQLQYGTWVAAASIVVQRDPVTAEHYRDVIDLLVADYAGAEVVPGSSSSLPAQRTWSPYEGHSWASGTARFGAGNNLESISESSFAWWAAARWFTVTGRPALAEPFLGRLAIESAVTGISWLPDGDQLPTGEARPWSGVVWGGKVDLATWFHPSPASALGIRLLPLGPASLARYATPATVAAAEVRWNWCDRNEGCIDRWANLVDSDAAVAGRRPLEGPEPEPSTSAATAAWWRDLWERSSLVEGWQCSVGATVRSLVDGGFLVLATNPAPEGVELTCRDESGRVRWSDEVVGARAVRLDP